MCSKFTVLLKVIKVWHFLQPMDVWHVQNMVLLSVSRLVLPAGQVSNYIRTTLTDLSKIKFVQ